MTETRVVMLHVSGHGEDSQWFDYRIGYFGDIVRVEWEKDTMEATLPAVEAAALIARGYAKEIEP